MLSFRDLFWYLGVKIAAGLWLRSSKQSNAVVVLLSSRSAAFSQVLPILQGQQMVSHPTLSTKHKLCVYAVICVKLKVLWYFCICVNVVY